MSKSCHGRGMPSSKWRMAIAWRSSRSSAVADDTIGFMINTAVPSNPAVEGSLRIGQHTLSSRLIVGTGKYDTFETMQQSLELSGTDCITVAVRRERLYDGQG